MGISIDIAKLLEKYGAKVGREIGRIWNFVYEYPEEERPEIGPIRLLRFSTRVDWLVAKLLVWLCFIVVAGYVVIFPFELSSADSMGRVLLAIEFLIRMCLTGFAIRIMDVHAARLKVELRKLA